MVALLAYPLGQRNILSTKYFLNADSGLIYDIELEPIGRHLPSIRGATILEVARSAGIPVNSVCGGRKTCGRCKVRIISGRTSALSKDEKRLLSKREIEDGYRLACAARVLGDIKIFIPPYALLKIPRLQLTGNEPDLVLDPVISEYKLQPEIISLNPNLADWENVKNLVDLYGLVMHIRYISITSLHPC
jgi:ferredoxin